MGKGKGRGDEHASRVNYLFQAGKMMAKEVPKLSQYYGQVLTVITEKTAPKKDFTMKRSMCNRCHTILKVGENATYRLKKNRHKKSSPNIIIGCLLCGERKRLPTSRGYRLNAEKNGQIINGSSPYNGNRRNPIPHPSPASLSSEDKPSSGTEYSKDKDAEMLESPPPSLTEVPPQPLPPFQK